MFLLSILLMLTPPQFTVEVIRPQQIEVTTIEEGGDQYYLAVFSAKWCGPCQAFARNGQRDRLLRRWSRSVVIDIDEQPEFRQRIPAVWLVRLSDRKVIRKWVGVTTVETVESEIRLLSPQQVKPPKAIPMSHAEMKRLHDQLHGGGSWTWPGDLETHLRTVHGVNVR